MPARKPVDYFRLIFAYTCPVFNLPNSRTCDYTVRCKGCGESIPAPVRTMPDTWIVAECPLCRDRRRYLPTEIFRGPLSHKLSTKKVRL
jgi:hypothetical protein